MNILLFTLEYPPFKGGVSKVYEQIVKLWPKPDEIFVLHNNEQQLVADWLFPKWLPALFALRKEIKKYAIKHVIVGQILPLGTVAYFLSFILKFKYTVIIHGMDFTLAISQSRKRWISQKILNRAEHIICINNYTSGLVRNFLGENIGKKVETVNPGINLITDYRLQITNLREKYNLNKKIVLFSVGRLVKRKGFDKVIEAMAEAVEATPNLHYYIAGDGPDKIYLHGKTKGVKNINFLGKIGDEEKWTWLGACDMFIMPSRVINNDYEGFGIVYLEANLMGKPVIAGDSGGVRDAVKGAYSGLLVDPLRVDRIAGAISALAQNADLRKKLGEQGRERVVKEFRWEDKVGEIYGIICKN